MPPDRTVTDRQAEIEAGAEGPGKGQGLGSWRIEGGRRPRGQHEGDWAGVWQAREQSQ